MYEFWIHFELISNNLIFIFVLTKKKTKFWLKLKITFFYWTTIVPRWMKLKNCPEIQLFKNINSVQKSLFCIRKFNCSPRRTTEYYNLIFYWWNTKVTTMRNFFSRIKKNPFSFNRTKRNSLFLLSSKFDWKLLHSRSDWIKHKVFFFFYFINSKSRSKAK